jgi:hypothetical protein
MNVLQCFTRPLSISIAAVMLALSLHLPVASATMIGTEAVVQGSQIRQESGLTQDALNREAVRAKLLSLDVDPLQVQARVDALTDAEVLTISQHLDQLPAGGEAVAILLVLILLLLIF